MRINIDYNKVFNFVSEVGTDRKALQRNLKNLAKTGALALTGVAAERLMEYVVKGITKSCVAKGILDEDEIVVLINNLALKNKNIANGLMDLHLNIIIDGEENVKISSLNQEETKIKKLVRNLTKANGEEEIKNPVEYRSVYAHRYNNGWIGIYDEDRYEVCLYLSKGTYFFVDEFNGYTHYGLLKVRDDDNEYSEVIICGVEAQSYLKIIQKRTIDEEEEKEFLNKYIPKTSSAKTAPIQITTPVIIDVPGGQMVKFKTARTRVKTLEGVIFKEKNRLLEDYENWNKNRESNFKFGINSCMGILLHGGHGTGKTALAKAISAEYCQDFYVITPDCNDPCAALSHIAKVVREKEYETTIIFIDEIDRLLNMQDETMYTEEKSRFASSLNQLMAGSDSLDNVIIIGATNRKPEDFPPDLMRKGRFGYQYEMNEINEELARDMCKFFEVDYDEVAAWYKEEKGTELPLVPVELQDNIVLYRQTIID